MPIELVEEANDSALIGLYRSTFADGPFCKARKLFVFLESRASPSKPMSVCAHRRARICDDDGLDSFDTEPRRPAQQAGCAEA